MPGAVILGDASVLYPRSVGTAGGVIHCLGSLEGEKHLVSASRDAVNIGCMGERISIGGMNVQVSPLTWETYQAVKQHLPWMVPASLRNERTTFGCGDRLGRATPGHIRGCRPYEIHPVLAQQSVRELNFTGRTYRDVVKDAAFLVLQEGYRGGYGADGDHIKYLKDIRLAVEAEMPMITLDLTEVMNPAAEQWSEEQVNREFSRLPGECRELTESRYAGKTFNAGSFSVAVSEAEAKRCALIYWRALEYTEEVDRYLRSQRGDAYDLEVSIDETSVPTEAAHHVFIASELQRRKVTVNSLAPRFIGEFQKGIDYIGDVGAFTEDFRKHSEIAKAFGGYKLSIHSGSDKFSVYPVIGRYSDMKVHVKTSGTSWLEALRTVSQVNPKLFRNIFRKAGTYAQEGLKQYHITADVSLIPPEHEVADQDLPDLLEMRESRQMLHICYGRMLEDPEVRTALFSLLDSFEESHYACVEKHIQRHIAELGTALKPV